MANRITQIITEPVIEATDEDARVTQLVAETVVEPTDVLARVTQLISEPVIDADSNVRVTQILAEVIISPIITPEPPTVGTFRFDDGLQSSWWIVPQLTDSGIELRDKVVKSFRATGKMTNPQFSVYGYKPGENIDVDAIEAGTGSKSGVKTMTSSTQVAQSARKQINVPNVMLHTVRLSGSWDGTEGAMKDRIDEIVYEVAQQGIRR